MKVTTMDMHLALQEVAAQHQLTPDAIKRLDQIAGLGTEPHQLKRALPFGIAVLGAVLIGLGIIFWIAANWDELGRAGHFALLQGVVLAMCAGALWRPQARVPLSLLAFLTIGGLFAYFGQTYQTGADPWQLFALWAGLTLPLCLGVRHDALWAPWALIAAIAVSLWIHASTGQTWRVQAFDLLVHLAGWGLALFLALALSPLMQKWTGAGLWALRTSILLATVIIAVTALVALLDMRVAPQYWLGLVMLGVAAATFATPQLFDSFALSGVCLGLNVLLVAGLAKLLIPGKNSDPVLELLVLGLIAAALLAATVSLILKLAKRAGAAA